MSPEEVARYVMIAYAAILVVFIAYGVWQGRRISALEREARLLTEELERREAGGRA
jgi:hypothetical protein